MQTKDLFLSFKVGPRARAFVFFAICPIIFYGFPFENTEHAGLDSFPETFFLTPAED